MKQPLERGAVGNVVVALPPLFLHHLALDVELFLRERREKESHPIGFQPQSESEVMRRQGLEVVRAIEEGGPIEDAADRLHVAEMLVVADVLRA